MFKPIIFFHLLSFFIINLSLSSEEEPNPKKSKINSLGDNFEAEFKACTLAQEDLFTQSQNLGLPIPKVLIDNHFILLRKIEEHNLKCANNAIESLAQRRSESIFLSARNSYLEYLKDNPCDYVEFKDFSGEVYKIRKDVVTTCSKTLQGMLEDTNDDVIILPAQITIAIIKRLAQYMHHIHGAHHVFKNMPMRGLPENLIYAIEKKNIQKNVNFKESFEILEAANYLGIEQTINPLAAAIAWHFLDKDINGMDRHHPDTHYGRGQNYINNFLIPDLKNKILEYFKKGQWGANKLNNIFESPNSTLLYNYCYDKKLASNLLGKGPIFTIDLSLVNWCSLYGIENIPHLQKKELVKSLDIKGRMGSFYKLPHLTTNKYGPFEQLDQLTSVNFSFVKLYKIDSYLLQGLKNLECLTVNECEINYIDSDAFKDLKSLRYLNLNANKLGTIKDNIDLVKLATALQSCKTLSTLNLSNNDITKLNNLFVGRLSALKTLILAGNKISEIELNSFEGSFNIEHIDLYNHVLTPATLNIDCFMGLNQLNYISFEGSKNNARFNYDKKLAIYKKLRVRYPSIKLGGWPTIEELQKLKKSKK